MLSRLSKGYTFSYYFYNFFQKVGVRVDFITFQHFDIPMYTALIYRFLDVEGIITYQYMKGLIMAWTVGRSLATILNLKI